MPSGRFLLMRLTVIIRFGRYSGTVDNSYVMRDGLRILSGAQMVSSAKHVAGCEV